MFQSPFYCLKKHKSGILAFWMWRPYNWALFLRKVLPNLTVKLLFLKENNILTEGCLSLVLHSPRVWTSTTQMCHDCSGHLHISFLNLEKALLSSIVLASRDVEQNDMTQQLNSPEFGSQFRLSPWTGNFDHVNSSLSASFSFLYHKVVTFHITGLLHGSKRADWQALSLKWASWNIHYLRASEGQGLPGEQSLGALLCLPRELALGPPSLALLPGQQIYTHDPYLVTTTLSNELIKFIQSWKATVLTSSIPSIKKIFIEHLLWASHCLGH